MQAREVTRRNSSKTRPQCSCMCPWHPAIGFLKGLMGLAVYVGKPAAGKRDLTRRNSSGNWIEDRVTWKEEVTYKKAMGYL